MVSVSLQKMESEKISKVCIEKGAEQSAPSNKRTAVVTDWQKHLTFPKHPKCSCEMLSLWSMAAHLSPYTASLKSPDHIEIRRPPVSLWI